VLAVGYWTGVRIGEIRSLRWSQVDFLDNVIRLREFETKNEGPRVVPMSGELRALLQAHRLRCPKDFVCYQPVKKGRVARLTTFPRTWARCCKQVGLEGKLFHDLRRSAAAGVSGAVAMRISGHKTRSIFTRYNIIDEKDLKKAGRKLETYIAAEGKFSGQSRGKSKFPPRKKNPLTN
jgi:integrase